MKNAGMHRRVAYSLAGIRDGWRRERSFRTHAALTALAIATLCLLRPSPAWWLALGIALAVGLAMELFNGALEALIDHLHPELHAEIRVAKDMASGGVLLVNLAALAIAAAMIATWTGLA